MKNRINKTGNIKGDQIIVFENRTYDGPQEITYEGTYLEIDDKGYVNIQLNDGRVICKHYKNCYKK